MLRNNTLSSNCSSHPPKRENTGEKRFPHTFPLCGLHRLGFFSGLSYSGTHSPPQGSRYNGRAVTLGISRAVQPIPNRCGHSERGGRYPGRPRSPSSPHHRRRTACAREVTWANGGLLPMCGSLQAILPSGGLPAARRRWQPCEWTPQVSAWLPEERSRLGAWASSSFPPLSSPPRHPAAQRTGSSSSEQRPRQGTKFRRERPVKPTACLHTAPRPAGKGAPPARHPAGRGKGGKEPGCPGGHRGASTLDTGLVGHVAPPRPGQHRRLTARPARPLSRDAPPPLSGWGGGERGVFRDPPGRP